MSDLPTKITTFARNAYTSALKSILLPKVLKMLRAFQNFDQKIMNAITKSNTFAKSIENAKGIL